MFKDPYIISDTSKRNKPKFKFIAILSDILDDISLSHIISWDETGTLIKIHDEKKFVDQVLARHFKHKCITNLIRQLNLYNFRKIKQSKQSKCLIYKNDYFKKNNESLLTLIKRKKNIKSEDEQEIKDSFDCSFDELTDKIDSLNCKIAELKNISSQLMEINQSNQKEINNNMDYIKKLEAVFFSHVKGEVVKYDSQLYQNEAEIEFTEEPNSFSYLQKKRGKPLSIKDYFHDDALLNLSNENFDSYEIDMDTAFPYKLEEYFFKEPLPSIHFSEEFDSSLSIYNQSN